MNHQQEHENWIRFHSVTLSTQINRYASLDKVIQDARRISSFILGKPVAEIAQLVDDKSGGTS